MKIIFYKRLFNSIQEAAEKNWISNFHCQKKIQIQKIMKIMKNCL